MEFRDVKSVNDLRTFLIDKGRGHQNYRHYTTMDGIYEMLKSGFIWLSRGDQMNDKQELTKGAVEDWRTIYIASFAFGKSENIAMWGIYGLPHDEAACISFPSKLFSQWVPEIDSVYDPKSNYRKIDCKFEVQLTDVAYVGGKRGSTDQILKWNEKSFLINESTKYRDLLYLSNKPQVTGFIKNYAWTYENEVRIRVKLDIPIKQKRIAIKIPDNFFDSDKGSEKVQITYGPWNESARKNKKIEIFENRLEADMDKRFLYTKMDILSSEFVNLVVLKETCNCCQLFTNNNNRIIRKATSLFQDV